MGIIEKLIQDNYKAVIVECGHGSLVANSFLSVNGASSLVLLSKQPYCKEVQQRDYPVKGMGMRSVSKEFIHQIMFSEMDRFEPFHRDDKFLILASSFQLGSDTSICHGYFGIGKMNGNERSYTVYHLTYYNRNRKKSEWIEIIHDELLNLLDNHIYGVECPYPTHVDGVWTAKKYEKLNDNISASLSLNTMFEEAIDDNILCYSPENKQIRFEDVVRLNKGEKKGIILQKGSFNPFHRAHNNIAKDAIASYPDYPHVLMLSGITCDKGTNTPEILEQRIRSLTKLGYYVAVSKSGYFIHNVEWIRQYYSDLNIIFPVGEDTIERFFRDWDGVYANDSCRFIYYKNGFENVEWFITNRVSDTKNFGELIPSYREALDNFKYSTLPIDEISSTKIRSGEIENIL